MSPSLSLSQQLQQQQKTMTSLSFTPAKVSLHRDSSFFLFQSTNIPQRITFPGKIIKVVCSATERPKQQGEKQQQHQSKRKKNVADGEKGIDPVGFLTKSGISHKQFAQFLRERLERHLSPWGLLADEKL